MASVVEFRVLGPLEVHHDHGPIALGSRRLRTLLAALLVDAGRVVSIDTLAEALWGDQPPADPRNAIQTYIARLRGALGDDLPLRTQSPGYVLEVSPDQVDAARFDRLLDQAQERRDDPAAARILLQDALALWRGPAYAEFADSLARTEALRLEEREVVAREELARARLALGEAGSIVSELRKAVAEQPLREGFVELLMRALATVDRQAEAADTYRAYRDHLAEETGLEPSRPIEQLHQAILRGGFAESAGTDRGGRAGDAQPPTARPSRPPAAIPEAPTSLVGRESELARLRELLAQGRNVTITGPGGVGKTRLAAAAATSRRRERGVEVAWVALGPVTDPAALDHVITAAVGIDPTGGRSPRQALLDALAERRLLLVLDNVEHVLEPAATLVAELQQGGGDVQVLATSRERLAVDGEQVLELAPLDTTSAARLFLERAGAVTDADRLADDLPAIEGICRELDGIPLAIELAAARTAALTLDDLLSALREDDQSVISRRRGTPERHRDLWAVVDWSYRLLDEDDRQLFDHLGVFAGSFDVAAVQSICAPDGWSRARTIDRLAGLTERSLVVGPASTPGVGAGRYRLLRPLRAFARQRLADREVLPDLADRHAQVITQAAERAAGPPLTEDGRLWLETSLDDLREARRRAQQTGDVALLGRLVAALYRFDYWRPGSELLSWADDALELDGSARVPTAPQLHAAAAAAAWMRGDLARAERLAQRAVGFTDGADDPRRAVACEVIGDVASFAGRLQDAEVAFLEAVQLARSAGDADGEATGLASTAVVVGYAGRTEEAMRLADEAEAAAAGAGCGSQAFARYAQGECRMETDPDQARLLVEEAAELARRCDAWFVEGVAMVTAASLWARHGDEAAALPAFRDLIRHWHRSGSWIQQWTTLRNLAELLVRLRCDDAAIVLAAAAETHRPATALFGADSDRLEAATATARERLGRDAYDAADLRGRHLSGNEAVAFALTTIDEVEEVARRP